MCLAVETRFWQLPSNSRMAWRLVFPLVLLVLADLPGTAQFGSPYPGGGGGMGSPGGVGYPGGGMGGSGLPFPGRRRNSQNVATDTLTGKLRRVSTSQFVLDPGDDRAITVSIERTTKFIGTSGGAAKLGDFDIGDQVSIDASRDNQNYYHALRVTLEQKAAASTDQQEPGNTPGTTSSPAVTSSPSTTSSNDDPDRPKLKRSGSSGPASASTSASTSDSPSDAPKDSPKTQTPRAQITSGDPIAEPSSKPVPREADDPGPPKLRRGATARVDNTPPAGSEPDTVASARPSIKAEDMNGVTRRQAPPVVSSGEPAVEAPRGQAVSRGGTTSTDPVIEGAREAALSFTESLPNYVVKQFTTRYQTDTAHGNRTSWQAIDVVTADVVAEGGKESYKNILVNGKAPRDAVEKTGSWSTGEFATILQGILAPQTDADFRGKRSTTIVNRAAIRYDYSVEQPNSMWHVFASAQSYVPGYTGSIWIDKENFRVLRIEMSARNMPKEFPLDTVESAVDYDYVLIGDQKFLLPVHSEALSCVRGTAECTRNVIDFRNYKKFGADTSIRFETDKN